MKEKNTKKEHLSPRRIFSELIKKQTVGDIERGKCTVTGASRELLVSNQTIYRWIYRYSRYLQKNKVLVVEDKSEVYRSKELERKIMELEAALGRKQIEIELLNKVIELANEAYKTDLKKNISKQPLRYSESKKDTSTDTK